MGHFAWNKGKHCENMKKFGESNPAWKGGISKDRLYILKRTKAWRHRNGISKNYVSCLGISHTREYKRLHRKKYKYNKKMAGELTIKTIQMVYEDNIKRFGTLTCYLCLNPIPFNKDHLEHRIPLSRGGNNEYSNLAVACQPCNNRKHAKTEIEYRKDLMI
jgi:5-methylcytosine-specific restriction endonuclease McrA